MQKQTKILLIDDDPDVHTVVKTILEPKILSGDIGL
jgi:CheY-like chemotaxis protein